MKKKVQDIKCWTYFTVKMSWAWKPTSHSKCNLSIIFYSDYVTTWIRV